MPLTGFTRIQPGDLGTASSLTSRLTAMQSAVNALPLNAVEQDSLTRQHLPTVVVGTPKINGLNLATTRVYDGRAANEPYPTWRSVNDVGGTAAGAVGNECNVTGLGVTLSSSVWMEVRAQCEIVSIQPWDFVAAAAFSTIGPWRSFAVFAIQYRAAAGAWNTVLRSRRYYDAESINDSAYTAGAATAVTQSNKRASIRALIRHTNEAGAITVDEVRLVMACWQSANAGSWAALAANAPNVRTRVELRKCSITAYGFQKGTLS
jgi:hypothetical protein